MRILLLVVQFILLTFSLPLGKVAADAQPPFARIPILGDQDGSEGPVILQAPGFELLPNAQTFRVPDEAAYAGTQEITFDLVDRQASFDNEFGFFQVDSVNGEIAGLYPGDTNYLAAAWQRATVIFPSGSVASTPDVTVTVQPGAVLVFFLVQAGTLADLKLQNPQNLLAGSLHAFFSLDALNPDGVDHLVGFRNLTEDLTQFAFEDLTGGGDLDYDDIVYNVKVALHPSPVIEARDLIVLLGLDSVGSCAGLATWVPAYLKSEPGQAQLSGKVRIRQVWNFNYAGGGTFACSDTTVTPAYLPVDTCDGIATAAAELALLLEERGPDAPRASIITHSTGGVVAAYLTATRDPAWLRQHLASVLTLDSPHQGVEFTVHAVQAHLASGCDPAAPADRNSLLDLTFGSPVQRAAQGGAARGVPFYTIDAATAGSPPLIWRALVVLDSALPFAQRNQCGLPGIAPATCEAPKTLADTHQSIGQQPHDQTGQDKGPLVGCALLGASPCTQQTARVSAGAAISLPYAVALTDKVIQFVLDVSQLGAAAAPSPVRMTLVSPDGAVYGPKGAGAIAAYSTNAGSEVYEIRHPPAGEWTIVLTRADSPTPGTEASAVEVSVGVYVVERSPGEARPPIAEAGGPYTATVGVPIRFAALGSWDPDATVRHYAWDFHDDGRSDKVTDFFTATHTYTAPFSGEVQLQVTDSSGLVASDRAPITVIPATPDLVLVKTAAADHVRLGEVITYTVQITNLGPGPAEDVQMVDNLPSALTLIRSEPGETHCKATGASLLCTFPTLAAGEQLTIAVLTRISGVGSITNQASVTSATSDPDITNNTSSHQLHVLAPLFLPMIFE